MSHLLATMNEDAAEEIDNPPALPDVGTMVVYIPRAGMMRMGRREFPAIVLGGKREEQTLELFVLMEPEDMMMESHVRFQGHNETQHCWRYRVALDAEMQTLVEIVFRSINSRMNAMAERLTNIEHKLAQVGVQIWGDEYEPIPETIFGIMQDFETRLKAAKKG